MTTIWKYQLQVADEQVLELPGGATPLCVQAQGETLCLWAVVEPGAKKRRLQIRIVGTGHEISGQLGWHLDTVQQCDGQLVWHVFAEWLEGGES